MGWAESPVRVGVRTGDTTTYQRRKLRDDPPQVLITTPESLSLLLSQKAWHPQWRSVRTIILDEVHALVGSKRGADLSVAVERLAAMAAGDPARVGLSATCRPAGPVAHFLVGPGRGCRVVEAEAPAGAPPLALEVEALIAPDEGAHRGLTYRRLIRRIKEATATSRTSVVFANTRAFAEKITHDLRRELGDPAGATIAAHHSALDAGRRREVEDQLKAGELKAVVTSTSLELGVDIGNADLSILVGLPGSVARCLQRVGRAGHAVGVQTRGVILAATAAELAGAVVTAAAARRGEVEPLRPCRDPLDVACQHLIGMACGGEWASDDAYALLRRSAALASLSRADFHACLAFLAGELAAPPGAYEPEPGSAPKWTSPRIWKRNGLFGIKNGRVIRWFWSNVGTITAGGVGPRPGRRSGDRDAGRGVCRAVAAGRPLRPRRSGVRVRPDRGAGRPRPRDRRGGQSPAAGRATARAFPPSWPATWPGSGSRPPRCWARGRRGSAPGWPRRTTSGRTRSASWRTSSPRRTGSARSPPPRSRWWRSTRTPTGSTSPMRSTRRSAARRARRRAARSRRGWAGGSGGT